MRKRDLFKPAVTKSILLFLAGFVWLCVGTMLLVFAYSWLSEAPRTISFMFFGFGVVVALLVHHFGFLKIVDKNIDRILPMVEKKCLFSFMTWKSYTIVIVMVTMGTLLRHSAIPRQYLAILYTGIGLALILSSLRYLRVFINELGKQKMF
jgi:Zn-dependent protease